MNPNPQQDDFSDLAEIKIKATTPSPRANNQAAGTNANPSPAQNINQVRERKFFVKEGPKNTPHYQSQKPNQPKPQGTPAARPNQQPAAQTQKPFSAPAQKPAQPA